MQCFGNQLKMTNKTKLVLSYLVFIIMLFILSFIPDLAHIIRVAVTSYFDSKFTEIEITKFLNVLRISLLFFVVYAFRLVLIKLWLG